MRHRCRRWVHLLLAARAYATWWRRTPTTTVASAGSRLDFGFEWLWCDDTNPQIYALLVAPDGVLYFYKQQAIYTIADPYVADVTSYPTPVVVAGTAGSYGWADGAIGTGQIADICSECMAMSRCVTSRLKPWHARVLASRSPHRLPRIRWLASRRHSSGHSDDLLRGLVGPLDPKG